jgi:hypothetical protein
VRDLPLTALVLQLSCRRTCRDENGKKKYSVKHTAETAAAGDASGWLCRNNGETFSEGFVWPGEGIRSYAAFFKSLF